MPINLNQPIYYPSEQPLVEEVVTWLRDVPTFEEIVLYLSKLPEELQEPIAYQAATLGVERLFEEKLNYFTGASWGAFLQALSEDDQLFYLSAFSKYASQSVMGNLGKEFSAMTGLVPPADITGWSRTFLGRLYSYVYIGITPDYLITRFYAHSLSRTQRDTVQLYLLSEELQDILTEVQNRFVQGATSTQDAKEREAAVLGKMNFVPSAAQKDMLEAGDTPDKVDFFSQVHLAAVAVHRVSELAEGAEIRENDVDSMVSFLLFEKARPVLLAKLVSLRAQVDAKAVPPIIPALVTRLATVWTLENVRSGKAADDILNLHSSLDELQKVALNILVYKQMRTEALIDVLTDPHFPEQIIGRLQDIHDVATLQQYISDGQGELSDERNREDFAKLIRVMHRVIQAIGPEAKPETVTVSTPPAVPVSQPVTTPANV